MSAKKKKTSLYEYNAMLQRREQAQDSRIELSGAIGSGLHNRRKLMRIPTQYVLSLLSRGLLRNQYINVLEPVGLPETAVAIGVWPDYQYDAFAVIVEDASFDEVPEGVACPEIEVKWTLVEQQIRPNSSDEPHRGSPKINE